MDLFGAAWENHPRRIMEQWNDVVSDEDLTLIPGDISWAMHLSDAQPDLAFIDRLRGQQLLLRGNHDYWWNSLKKVRAALPQDQRALQNDCVVLDDYAICGTRGWLCPGAAAFSAGDEKIYARELTRLELSLKSAPTDKKILLMMHFPPFCEKHADSGFTQLTRAYGVHTVVYGHLHSASAHQSAFVGTREGTRYQLVAGDYLQFVPLQIL